jgi:hypothetical protein
MEDKIKDVLTSLRTSIGWINGRINNIQHGANFMNESFDIMIEAKSILHNVERMRKAIEDEKRIEREPKLEQLPRKYNCPCGSTDHEAFDCPVDDWQ